MLLAAGCGSSRQPLAAGTTTSGASHASMPSVAYVSSSGIRLTSSVPVVGGPGDRRPRWSANGARLAYLDAASALWVQRPDGDPATKIAEHVSRWDWSPHGSRIAAIADGLQLTVTDLGGSGSWTAPAGADDFIWSPDGSRLAYSEVPAAAAASRVDRVFVANFDTPTPGCEGLCPALNQVVFELDEGDSPTADVGVLFGGWSPDEATLLVWADENHSSSIAMDGLQLDELPLAGGSTRAVTRTLVRRDWIAWSPDGRSFLTVRSSGRTRGDSPRSVVRCELARAGCTAIADGAVDPSWSPDGRRVSFVLTNEPPSTSPDHWAARYRARMLVVAFADGTDRRDVPKSIGAASPRWLDDDLLLYVRDGGLWTVNPVSGDQREIVQSVGIADDTPPGQPYEATDLLGFAWTNSFDLRGG